MAKNRKFTKEEITAMRVAKGLDASDPRARQRVAYAEKKGRVKAWVADEVSGAAAGMLRPDPLQYKDVRIS